mgnify:CR=1 FL=1
MIFNQGNYYHALDRKFETDTGIDEPIELTTGEKALNTNLGPKELGATTNPFTHQLEALNAKIKEGASKIEFAFFGAGKGNRERSTPESFDSEERRQMRELAKINEVKTSTHASVGVQGLAGFDPQRGFEEQTRDKTLKEIEKAIDFAADASTGGAIVLHTGEWNRPIVDQHGEDEAGGEKFKFKGYEGEEEKAPIMVVDRRTGDVQGMRKDTPVYEPVFKTVKDREKELGRKLVGTKDPETRQIYEPDDWISVNDNVIKRDWEFAQNPEKMERMFERVPVFNEKKTNFETVRRDWEYFKKKADRWNERHPNPEEKLTPEEIFAKTQYMNSVLQAKGSSLYHGRFYNNEKQRRDEAKKALEFYEQLDDSLPEEEKKKLVTRKIFDNNQIVPPKDVPIVDYLKEQVKQQEDSMRYTHEASAAADVQAKQAQEKVENVTTLEKYGIEKSAESLAGLGIKAWKKYLENKDHLDEPLYIAPENWHPDQYGSHPDELANIIKAGRKRMVEELAPAVGKEEAEKLAKTHIKSTLDTGHLNLWRSQLERKPNESEEQFDKRFKTWAVEKVKKLHKEGVLGHLHLTDNFGYDDEHTHIGKGNTPIKELVETLTERGYDDFIVEAGSFNAQTVMPEAWAYFGSPIYGAAVGGSGGGQRFSQVHKQHFGYDQPPFYVVGGYSPSNEWQLWSQVPLE